MNYISLCFDKNYLSHVKTLINSIIQNNQNLPITFCLFFWWNESDLNKSHIKDFVEKSWKKIKYRILDESVASNLKSCSYLWKATYYRLYIPKMLLKENIDKTLYIDCDIICNGNIGKLFNIELDDKYFAVCFENWDYESFNAGVMLIDCEKWEKDCLSEKLIKFIEDNPDKITVWDQSALNLVIKPEHYLLLPPRYNLTVQYWYYNNYKYKKNQIKTEVKNAVFYHFNWKQKPWNYFCEHPRFNVRYVYMDNPSYKVYLLNLVLHKIWVWKFKRLVSSSLKFFRQKLKSF